MLGTWPMEWASVQGGLYTKTQEGEKGEEDEAGKERTKTHINRGDVERNYSPNLSRDILAKSAQSAVVGWFCSLPSPLTRWLSAAAFSDIILSIINAQLLIPRR